MERDVSVLTKAENDDIKTYFLVTCGCLLLLLFCIVLIGSRLDDLDNKCREVSKVKKFLDNNSTTWFEANTKTYELEDKLQKLEDKIGKMK